MMTVIMKTLNKIQRMESYVSFLKDITTLEIIKLIKSTQLI